MARLAHTGPDWGCILNCLKQWSVPGDKRDYEKSEWTGELWSGWRDAQDSWKQNCSRNGLLSHCMASQAIDYFSVLSWMVISLVACDVQVAPG